MRLLVATLFFLLAPTVCYAQEEPEGAIAETEASRPGLTENEQKVAGFVEAYLARGGPAPTPGSMWVQPPGYCDTLDFPILDPATGEFTGEVFRILKGQCAGDMLAYTHNPERRRVYNLIFDPDAVEQKLETLWPSVRAP